VTAQSSLFNFTSAAFPPDALPRAPPRDPYSADSTREFSDLFKIKHGRRPKNGEIKDFWASSPSLFEEEQGESLKSAKARAGKAISEADKHWEKQRERDKR
jgi:hypothetical protein